MYGTLLRDWHLLLLIVFCVCPFLHIRI